MAEKPKGKDKKWQKIQDNVKQVLESKHPEPIKINSFWNDYRNTHGELPELSDVPFKLNVRNRSQIFDFCVDICEVYKDEQGVGYVVLKIKLSKNQKKKQKKEQKADGVESREIEWAGGDAQVKPKEKATSSVQSKRKGKNSDVLSQLTELQIGSSGAYSKLSGGRPRIDHTPAGDNSVAFDLNLEFPELGANPAEVDTMAMRDHDARGNHSYHPYAVQPMAHQIPSFYDQFYSQSGATNPGTGSSTHQYQQAHGSNPTDILAFHQSATRTYLQSASTSSHDRTSGSSRDRYSYHSGTTRHRDDGSRSSHYSSGTQHGPPVFASKEQLNLVAKEAISRLAEAKEYVSVERVEKLILQHFNVSNLSQLKVRNIEHIDAVKELSRAHGKSNAYIQAFMRTRSVSTLYELQSDLENLCCKTGEDFESLQIGPLQTQPIVYDFFKFPEKATIPHISTSDILDMLRDWLSENNLWASRDLDLEKFMEFMQEARGLETPYELGVRVRSLILLIQVLKRAQSECARSSKDIMKRQKDNFKDDLTIAFQNLTRSLLEKDPGSQCVVKRQYCADSSLIVVISVFDKMKMFYDTLTSVSGAHRAGFLTTSERRGLKQLNEILVQFKSLLLNDPVHMDIFRLAVCASATEIHEQLWERIVKHFQKRIPTSQKSMNRHVRYDSDDDVMIMEDEDEEQQGPPVPSRGEMEESILKYLQRCVVAGSLTLAILHRIEAKVSEDFGFDNFTALGYGSYLECLTSTPKIENFLKESGGMALGGSQHAGGRSVESVYHTTQHQLIDFIRQANITDMQQVSLLEDSICSHYHVTDVKNLGQGTAQHLMTINAKPQQRQSKEFTVLYEGAICANVRGLSMRGERQVGVLGHQTKDKALACLQNCPLLDNLEEWSHWDLVFKPEYGDLKEFVQKNGKVHNSTITENGEKYTMTTHIIAMETKPGTLLKLTTDTSPEKFEEAVNNANVIDTCGHLLSLLAMNKGIASLPMPLLGNHVKTALIKIQAQEETSDITGEYAQQTNVSKVCKFVVDCLTVLPFATSQAVTNKVFLEPLSQVVGSAKSKDLLFHAAHTSKQQGRLQILGCALGITEWVNTFEKRTKPPRECLEKHDVPMELAEMGPAIEISDDETEDSEEVRLIHDLSSDAENNPLSQPDATVSQHDTAVADEAPEEDSGVTGLVSKMEPSNSDDAKEDEDQSELAKPKGDDSTLDDDEMLTEDTSETTTDVNDVTVIVELPAQVDPCFALIERIRRDKFGVDVEMDEKVRNLFQSHKEIIGRSLDRLSNDLYSKDTHFVLELIQNADDNDYPGLMGNAFHVTGDADPPAVLFRVQQHNISVFNNETGFTEKNITAVCDVGRSTKGKHKFGYIGQKGIGFKSVFRVTDRPEIHSNGFHMCFDVHSGPMGYIMPHWIGRVPTQQEGGEQKQGGSGTEEGKDKEQESEDCDDVRENVDNEVEENSVDDKWTTNIVLPLKQSAKEQGQMRSLAARFHDVHPSLLLFLHRLRNLTIINEVENYTQDIMRRDRPNGVVEISHTSGTDRWLVVKQMLDASKISQHAKSGVDVESTEIALAFQLQDKQQLDTQVLPQKQPVFAFLPLRSYGFRFVIQGDFDVPSSREDVDRDSVWNQWLIGHVHELFVNALQAFKTQPGTNEVDAVCSFLQYLPLEDEILDFFRPVATKILHQVRAKPCLPTQPGKNKVVQWKMPSKLVVCKDSLVKDIVRSELLQQQLSLDYLHPQVVSRLNSSLISTLGVQSLTTQHLLDLGNTTISQLSAEEATIHDGYTKKLEFLAKWLTCIFRSIDELQPDESVMSQLKQLPIIPLAKSQMVKLTEKTVFFPINDERKNTKKKLNNLMRLLAEDLNTIEPQLFNCLDDVANSQVHKLLDMLGVKVMTPYEVINRHIMPVLKSDAKQDKSREMLFAYLVYMKEELEMDPSIIDKDEVKKYAIVLTNKGPRNPATQAVHFSTVYGNAVDLVRLLPGHEWVLVDACYLQGSKGKYDIQGWYNFLAQLGVLDFLSIKQSTKVIKRDELDNSPWAAEKDLLPELDEYKVCDSFCTELAGLMTENQHPASYFKQMKCLYQLLEINFDTMYKQHTGARIMTLEGQPLRDVESTFSTYLKSIAWLPASVVTITDSNELKQETETRLAEDLYVRTPNIEKYLSFHVPYLDCDVSSSSTFSDFLRMQKLINIDTVKNMLIQWCSPDTLSDDDEVYDVTNEEETEFLTSMTHIKSVYLYLQQNLAPKDLQDLVQNYPIIFHTSVIPENSTVVVVGKFVNYKQVWWGDPSGMFNKYKSIISSLEFLKLNKRVVGHLYHEPECRDMFVRQGRVPAGPSFQEYASLLTEIPAAVPLVNTAIADVLKLYHIIGSKVLSNEEGLCEREDVVKLSIIALKPILKDANIIPSKLNRWVRLEDHPMIADDRLMEKMWADKPGVHYVNLGDKRAIFSKSNRDTAGMSIDVVTAMLKALGVATLSEVIDMEPTTEMYEPCPQVQLYVHRLVPYIQKLLLTEHEEVYAQLQAKQVKSKLAVLRFAQVSKLEMVYKLKNLPGCDPVVKTERCRLINDQEFSVLKAHVKSYGDINRELARFFSLGDRHCDTNIRNFVTELVELVQDENYDSEGELQRFCESRDITSLPHDEEPWEVPKPLNWPPPPTPPPAPVTYPMVFGQQPGMFDVARQVAMDDATSDAGKGQEDGDKKPGLRAWPPQAPRAMHTSVRPAEDRKHQTSWPPPAPPKNTSYKELPEGVTMPPRKPQPTEAQDDVNMKERNEQRHEHDTNSEGQGHSGSHTFSHAPRSADERPGSPGSHSLASEGGTRHTGTSQPGYERSGSSYSSDERHQGQHHGAGNASKPQTDKPPMLEGDSAAQPGQSRTPMDTSDADQGEATNRERSTNDSDDSYARSQSEIEMEYVENNDVHRVKGGEKWADGNKSRAPMKRARVDSGDGTTYDEQPRKPLIFYGNPVWTEAINETEYEELAQSDELTLPDDVGLTESNTALDVAVWGEKLVYSYLQKLQNDPNSDIIEVKWMNGDTEYTESGAPYDFALKVTDPQGQECVDVYIEVKSTRCDTKAFFEISSQQFRFAHELQEHFHLYRVFNAGDHIKARLTKLVNISQLLDKKQVRLCMVV